MAFNLADVLKDVSNLDTGREQIEYIALSLIDEDPNNFYELTDIPQLADNISLCGLQQPIRVRKKDDGRYIIVSGHRRRAALEMLVADGFTQWTSAPCIVEHDAVSPSLQQLRLIYANANTRKMSSAEMSQQAEQVEKLLYQLKEEGYSFPGRMRDHVAEAIGASKSKLARLKVIRENLSCVWTEAWKDGKINESVAYNLSQLPSPWQDILFKVWGTKPGQLYADTVSRSKDKFQKISEIKCRHGLNFCENTILMMEKSCKEMYCTPCTGCCIDCSSLQTCKSCCAQALDKQKEMKAIARKANQDAKAAQEERDRPGAEFARLIWQRVGTARKKHNVSVESIVRARGESFFNPSFDIPKQERMENGEGQYSPGSTVSFGYNVTAADLMRVTAVADALSCSVDYLLGRTDRVEKVPNLDTMADWETHCAAVNIAWETNSPIEDGDYLLMLCPAGCEPQYEPWRWENGTWSDAFGPYKQNIDGEILGWIPMPKHKKRVLKLDE